MYVIVYLFTRLYCMFTYVKNLERWKFLVPTLAVFLLRETFQRKYKNKFNGTLWLKQVRGKRSGIIIMQLIFYYYYSAYLYKCV